jgi:hypothetical protein
MGFSLHPEQDDPVWQGRKQPAFSKAILGGQVCKDRDERGLPTRVYYAFTDKKYCEKREQYAREYYAFWQTQGDQIPHLTRIPDATSVPLCGADPTSHDNQH